MKNRILIPLVAVAAATAALGAASAAPADDFVGRYAAKEGSYSYSLVITPAGPGAYKVAVGVGSQMPACSGDVEAMGRLSGGQIVTLPPAKGDSCSFTITRTRTGVTAKATPGCGDWHGQACDFGETYVRVGPAR